MRRRDISSVLIDSYHRVTGDERPGDGRAFGGSVAAHVSWEGREESKSFVYGCEEVVEFTHACHVDLVSRGEGGADFGCEEGEARGGGEEVVC